MSQIVPQPAVTDDDTSVNKPITNNNNADIKNTKLYQEYPNIEYDK